MFIGLISAVIVILGIVSYMATSGIVSDAAAVKVTYEKIKYIYPIEKTIVDSVENLCQKDFNTCKSKIIGGEIILTFNDLVGYIPDNFINENLNNGTFTEIKILNNFTTVRLTQNIDNNVGRKIYLNHYKGREYGIPPKCVIGSEISSPVCNSTIVYHDYPTSLETRSALE